MPEQMLGLSSSYDLGDHWEFDITYQYNDHMVKGGADIDAYDRLDIRLGWKPRPNLQIDLVGQNLLDDVGWEMQEALRLNTGVERSVQLRITLRF